MGFKAGYANYPGNQTHIVGEVKGPTTYGSMCVATEAHYDQEADTTRVRFDYFVQEQTT